MNDAKEVYEEYYSLRKKQREGTLNNEERQKLTALTIVVNSTYGWDGAKR